MVSRKLRVLTHGSLVDFRVLHMKRKTYGIQNQELTLIKYYLCTIPSGSYLCASALHRNICNTLTASVLQGTNN